MNTDLTSKSVHILLNHENHRQRYLRNPADAGCPFLMTSLEFPWGFFTFYANNNIIIEINGVDIMFGEDVAAYIPDVPQQ